MKRILSVVLMGSLGITAFGPVSVLAQQENEQKVIVVFDEEVDKKAVQAAEGKINQTFRNMPIASATVPANELKNLQEDPNVLRIEKDVTVQAAAQTLDWGIGKTNVPASWNAGFTGKNVKVAVIDTGVAPHSDLIVAGGKSVVPYTASYHDDNGHGTHVAGIIGAKDNSIGTKGVAPDVQLYAVKALGKDGAGSLSSILAGIDWAITNKMNIINLSLGLQTHSAALQASVDKAYANGILVVAAAGNDGLASGSGDTVDYPARYSSVIAVSAVDSSLKRAAFSATGSAVEVAAPGVDILSPYLNNAYAKSSGTSMAAPYVAGELALLKQANPGMSSKELRNLLVKTSKDLGTAGKDPWYGTGLMQAPAASSVQSAASLSISESELFLLPGKNKKITVTSASQIDITKEAVWTTDNPKVATVQNGEVNVHGFGKARLKASFGGQTLTVFVNSAVKKVEVSTKKVSGKPGTVQKVKAFAVMENGTKIDITGQATWKTANDRVAVVEGGSVSVKTYGKTYIAANFAKKSVNLAVLSKK